MKLLMTWLSHPIATAKFAWYLWRHERYDGTGHKIGIWYAITLAADREFWGLTNEREDEFEREDESLS
jgi:hypothetical protein